MTRLRDLADRRVPARAVAFVVAHDKIRRGVQIRTLIELAGRVDLSNRDRREFLVTESGELRDQFALQRFGFRAPAHDALRFAPLQVQVESAESQRISARAGPVHVVEIAAGFGGLAGEREIAVLMQPGVQIDGAAEAAESVVGEDEEHRIRIHVLHGFSHQRVHALIEVGDRALPLRVAAAFEVAIEHVLNAVAGIEDARHHAAPGVRQRVVEHGLALGQQRPCLVQERPLVDHAFIERPGILRHADGREGAEQFGQIHGVVSRVADGQRGRFGIDLDGRDIERKFRLGFGDEETRDAVDIDAGRGGERDSDPRRILARPQWTRSGRDLAACTSRRGESGTGPDRTAFATGTRCPDPPACLPDIRRCGAAGSASRSRRRAGRRAW